MCSGVCFASRRAWKIRSSHAAGAGALLAVLLGPAPAEAQPRDTWVLGFALQAGGRADNVRMCVATPADVPGGPAFDISFFFEHAVVEDAVVHVDVPVMRPVLFAAAFDMLQFEPSVALRFRQPTDSDVDVLVGPSLGLTLHYGPDYRSEASGEGRLPSFFALGPRFGGYAGLDFKRPDETFNFELGLHPYLSPLVAIDDPESHRGVVVGGMLEGQFRFKLADP